MLDAFIIKRIQDEKEKERKQRPSLEVETPNRPARLPEQNKSESNRGVAIIDFSI